MSSATAIPIDDAVKLKFQSPNTQTIVARIEKERVELVETIPSVGSTSSDFNALKSKAKDDAAAYFLFRAPNAAAKWWLISWIPDGSPPADKMVYAATKATLKSALGLQSFVDDINFSTRAEFDYDEFRKSRDSSDVGQSAREAAIAQLDAAEAEARKEAAGAASTLTTTTTATRTATTAASSSASPFGVTLKSAGGASASPPVRRPAKAQGGIGGYHAVKLPLSSGAAAALDRVVKSQATLAVFMVNAAADGIENDGDASNGDTAAFAQRINETEPRFYVFRESAAAPRAVFAYVCPDQSAQKLRMVYSTAKASISDALASRGASVSKALEWDSADCREFAQRPSEFLRSELAPARAAGGRSVVPQARQATTNTPHRLAALMTGDTTAKVGSKKIVIPPQSAW